MAISQDVPGLKVEIRVNKEPLKEYDDDPDEPHEPRSVTKYVEAVSGAEFEIVIKLTCSLSLEHDCKAIISIDGKRARHPIFYKEKYPIVESHHFKGVTSSQSGKWFRENFCFSELNIDENEMQTTRQTMRTDLDSIGEILIEFYYIKNIRPKSGDATHSMATTGLVSEKALKVKALSHEASLKPKESIRARSLWTSERIEPNGNPFASFRYKYRSKEALKTLHIIPRTPSPTPLEERSIDDLSLEEARELLRRQREREETQRQIKLEGIKREGIKRERDDSNDEEVQLVSTKHRKNRPNMDEDGLIETIDLT